MQLAAGGRADQIERTGTARSRGKKGVRDTKFLEGGTSTNSRSHRPMHLYPARLDSALPASVARQSLYLSPSLPVSLSLTPPPPSPLPSALPVSCIRFFFISVHPPLPSPFLSPAPRNRSVDLRTPRRRRRRRGGRRR